MHVYDERLEETAKLELSGHGVRVPHMIDFTPDGAYALIAATATCPFGMGFGSAFDKSTLTTVPAGGMVILPPKVQHFVLAQGETVVQVHGMGPTGITYVNPADDPRQRSH